MQGISPTLLYPVPTREESWLLSKIIHSVRDYYPLWQVCFLFLLMPTYLNLSNPQTARIPKYRVHVPFVDLCRSPCAPQAMDQGPFVCAGGDFGGVGVGSWGGFVWVVE